MPQLWTDKIVSAIQAGRNISHSYKLSKSQIKVLGNGVIYIKADMDTDADGSPRATQIDPKYGQLPTSLRRSKGWRGASEYVNAETIPYFVLPGNFASVSNIGCRLGDLALIRWQGHEIFAIYADEGPTNKIGEGSIKLVEALGENPWNASKTEIISGIEFGVEYLVFPKSTATRLIPSSFDEIQSVGLEVFCEYFDNGTYSMTQEEMQEKAGENDVEVWEIMNAPNFKILTDLNLRPSVSTSLPPITVIPIDTVVKSLVDSSSQRPKVFNVGFGNNGLWLMVKYNNQKGFVRASKNYILPWHQN
jgi:hypothetical protein